MTTDGSRAPRQHSTTTVYFVGLGVFFGAILTLAGSRPAMAGSSRLWVPEGPAPTTGGQVENLSPDDEVSGSINAVLAHPTNADVIYIGSSNGGVWKTSNATATSPNWTPLTDHLGSLSIGAIDMDPLDATHQTLVAGIGRFSSFSRRGGDRLGVLKTTDGGASWTVLDGGGTLTGKNISGIAVRGSTIVVSVNTADVDNNSNRGVYRSSDDGASFVQLTLGNGSTTGLPDGRSLDIGRSAAAPAELYTVVDLSSLGQNGLYRSSDTGASWSKVSDSPIEALLVPTPSNAEFAINPNGIVYLAIARSGTAAGVFRSADHGTTWKAMDVPSTNPGGQASVHFSLVADPVNDQLVYIGGDIQIPIGDYGSTDYTGRLFRGNAANELGSQWFHLTHRSDFPPVGGGTASASAPHGDSREMDFDAAGNIIEVDDGGISKRTSPQDNKGDWFSLNGDLQVTEQHSMSWDRNAGVLISGAQDTGTPAQLAPGGRRFFSVSTADGGDVAVDDISTPGLAARYSSYQNLGGFRRQVRDAANTLIAQTFPARTLVGGGAAMGFQFVTPVVVNGADGDRLILGGSNGVYESLDAGTTIRAIGAGITINSSGSDPVAYGIASNPELLWVGASNRVYVRSAANPAPLAQSLAYPGTTVAAIVADPDQGNQAFVVDGSNVYRTTDTGASWASVTGNLGTFSPGRIESLEYLASSLHGDGIAVGTNHGVYLAREDSGFSTWSPLGQGLPDVRVFELDYDAAADKLLAGTLGRGAFSLSPAIEVFEIFVDGFESGTTAAWSLTLP